MNRHQGFMDVKETAVIPLTEELGQLLLLHKSYQDTDSTAVAIADLMKTNGCAANGSITIKYVKDVNTYEMKAGRHNMLFRFGVDRDETKDFPSIITIQCGPHFDNAIPINRQDDENIVFQNLTGKTYKQYCKYRFDMVIAAAQDYIDHFKDNGLTEAQCTAIMNKLKDVDTDPKTYGIYPEPYYGFTCEMTRQEVDQTISLHAKTITPEEYHQEGMRPLDQIVTGVLSNVVKEAYMFLIDMVRVGILTEAEFTEVCGKTYKPIPVIEYEISTGLNQINLNESAIMTVKIDGVIPTSGLTVTSTSSSVTKNADGTYTIQHTNPDTTARFDLAYELPTTNLMSPSVVHTIEEIRYVQVIDPTQTETT